MSDVNYNSVLATRLRELLNEKAIKQNEIANAIGSTRQAISQYCDGSTIPNADKLAKMAIYLNVSTDYLLGLTNASAIADTDEKKTIRTVCDYTHLNEKAVEILHKAIYKRGHNIELQAEYEEAINFFINSMYDTSIFKELADYRLLVYETIEDLHSFKYRLKDFEENITNDKMKRTAAILICSNYKTEINELLSKLKFKKFCVSEAFYEVINKFTKTNSDMLMLDYIEIIQTIDNLISLANKHKNTNFSE